MIQSVWNDMKKQNKLRQTESRRTVATSPRSFKKPSCKVHEKLWASAPRAKAALNAKVFTPNVDLIYSIFTQVPKTFNSTVALQVDFLYPTPLWACPLSSISMDLKSLHF